MRYRATGRPPKIASSDSNGRNDAVRKGRYGESAVKKAPIKYTEVALRKDNGSRSLVPALVAVGGGLAAMPAAALELGEVTVNSSLGQPLRASIAYALGPNEAISDSCVSLGTTSTGAGLPSITRGTVSVSNGVIGVSSRAVIREPLLSLRVNIRCPYTPHLSRDYMLFIDPAQPATQVEPAVVTAAPQPEATRPAAAPAVVRRRPVNREPIANATRYRVQPGDSLSLIAQRIENRPVGLWDAVGAIFDANPDAFINDDPNRLKAGSWLEIPDFGAGQPLTVADKVFSSAPAEPTGAGATQSGAASDTAAADTAAATYEPELTASSDAIVEPEAIEPEVVEPPADTAASADSPLADLVPGDVIMDSDGLPAATVNETVVIPDTVLDGPEVTSSSPNVPTATIQPAQADESGTNWFLWLIGAGVAIIVALLFGRSLRGRYGSTPVGATVTVPQRRKSDTASHRMPPMDEHIEVQEIAAVDDEPDVTIDDDSPTEENLALDADLAIGTGLTESKDVDLAQDFGFAATTDLDLELPEEMSSGHYQAPETDIIPPLNSEMESILESEVLPDTEDDEYDMSVIVDATKMPHPDDVTQRDLEAVEVPTSDETLISDDYTVSQDVDYKILEQDYEDEMTATQVLNQEISRAAEELALRMDEMEADEDTSEMSLASVTALDVTAQLTAKNDELGDLDDTGINEAVSTVNMDGDEKTVEMDSNEKTVEMEGDEKTVEMPADDSTVEMPAKKAGKR